jgi:hypothetical protein
VIVAGAVLTPAPATGPLKADMAELSMSYNKSTGRFDKSWWQSAVALSTLETYQQETGDSSYQIAISDTFAHYARTNFENSYNDDTGWWALAWLQAYQLTRSPAAAGA